jgi:hypothetical protein
MGTDNTITTTIIEVMTTLEAPSNPVTTPHYMLALASQNHVSFARNQVIALGTIALRNK